MIQISQVVAINDLTDAKTLAHLFKYDSVHGVYPADVRYEGDELIVGDNRIKVFAERGSCQASLE